MNDLLIRVISGIIYSLIVSLCLQKYEDPESHNILNFSLEYY